MKITEIIKMWWTGLTDTDTAIKKLEKAKLTFKDGAYSLIALSFITSLFFLVGVILLSAISGYNLTTMLTEGLTLSLAIFASASIIAIIGLAVFAWLFRKIANRYKGKGKFEKEAGFFGIIGGMLFLTIIPYFVGYLLMFLVMDFPIIAYSFYGVGLLLSVAYAGKISGIMIETLVEMEGLKINKVSWIQGLTIGILYLGLMVFFGLISQITGTIIPIA